MFRLKRTNVSLLRTGGPLTGRQIHGLVNGNDSLWSVQETLKTLTQVGLLETRGHLASDSRASASRATRSATLACRQVGSPGGQRLPAIIREVPERAS